MNMIMKKENIESEVRVNNFDHHIKAFYMENLGIKVISTDDNGFSVIDTIKPLKSYVNHQIMNI